ncbi:KilA-N domain-containing protein [Acidithiobacillus ferriphilus]|uniref:KilA-N domain-containing protein n=1 Tax=Acidithiobacillus ferriphilus TaxID=1689834 RepID=UPI001C06FA38|nr:KilA-N domain-containing protein [Acidithiobacillus ferriphilus]MBU2848125.1 KilA-N domain-containing protein [Acidithiobacillus ferriphilus]
MSKTKKSTIEVKGIAVTVLSQASDDYISLTDIAKHKEPDRSDHVIQNWMRNRNTIEFLGVWERLKRLNEIAIRQMQVLTGAMAIRQLKG